MKILFQILIILTSLAILINCSGTSVSDENSYYSEEFGFEDGKYCADVTYNNSNTGTKRTYKLEVEVEDNKLITIIWNNGGWLNQDHFYPETLDESGYCSFTSDKQYDYEVQIIGKNCEINDADNFQKDIQSEQQA